MILNEFLRDNLISGYQNNSFTAEQVVIFSMNYLNKGQIKQADFDSIMAVLYPPEPEPEQSL